MSLMSRRIRDLFVSAVVFSFAAGALAQPTKEDQNCIREVDKNLSKIAKTINKEAQKCIKDQAKGKIASAQACLDADAKGKQARALQKAADNIPKKCTIATPLLDDMFGTDNIYGQTAGILQGAIDAAQGEGINKETRLLQIMFGSDLDAGAAIGSNPNKAVGRCQQALTRDFFKCQDTKLKEFEKCKKLAMKNGADTGQEIQDACLGTGTAAQPDDKGKIAKLCVDKIALTLQSKCTNQGVSGDLFFPGTCFTAPDTIGCIETAIECDVCSSLNAVDGMHRDCDLFDNGLADSSCGVCRNSLDQAALDSMTTTEAQCIVACAGTPGCVAGCGVDTADPACDACIDDSMVCLVSGAGTSCLPACADPTDEVCQFCLDLFGCTDCLNP